LSKNRALRGLVRSRRFLEIVTTRKKIRRKVLAAHRKLREFRMIAKGLVSTRHPLLVHIIPIRRCNLACTYCNEFDDFSKPVPTDEMFRRIDRLGAMGTSIITISGGEPLLHPDLDAIVARIRRNGIMAGLITNGYLLVVERIEALNRAGLEYLQISIDNVNPDEVSKKSLKVLDQKLKLLAEHAEFQVNINSVLGGGVANSEDALTVAHRAIELGFTSTVGILHDHNGQLQPLGPREQEIFEEIMSLGKQSLEDARTTGVAAPGLATYTSARTVWCITARNSVDTLAYRLWTTRWSSASANF
jgi:MoaA/NifB/PqqE/SkfB family radical SAM enzyme